MHFESTFQQNDVKKKLNSLVPLIYLNLFQRTFLFLLPFRGNILHYPESHKKRQKKLPICVVTYVQLLQTTAGQLWLSPLYSRTVWKSFVFVFKLELQCFCYVLILSSFYHPPSLFAFCPPTSRPPYLFLNTKLYQTHWASFSLRGNNVKLYCLYSYFGNLG